jgi:hypothetical protein
VSSYLAFSPLPVLCCQRTGGVFSVTLSVTAIFQPRRPRFLRGMSPYGVRTFLQQALPLTSDHLPSAVNLAQHRKSGSQEPKKTGMEQADRRVIQEIPGFLVSRFIPFFLLSRFKMAAARSGRKS